MPLSDKQQMYLALAWQCFEAEPKIDFEKFHKLAGLTSVASAREMMRVTKKKLKEEYGILQPNGATPSTPKKTPGGTPKKTPRGTGKKRSHKESESGGESEEGDGEGSGTGSPAKQKKTKVKTDKEAAMFKKEPVLEEEDDDGLFR